MINKLLQNLDLPDTDYWYDEGCQLTRNIIDNEAQTIFFVLLSEWSNWDKNRQLHLACILGEGDTEAEKQLITAMFLASDSDVKYLAKKALLEFSSVAIVAEN